MEYLTSEQTVRLECVRLLLSHVDAPVKKVEKLATQLSEWILKGSFESPANTGDKVPTSTSCPFFAHLIFAPTPKCGA